MSLEDALAKLTEAVEVNSKLLGVLTSKGKTAIDADAKKPAKVKPTTMDADEDETIEKPARGRGRPKGTAKPKTPSVKQMRETATAYLEAAGEDEDDYAARKKKLKAIVAKFKADKFTEIAEEHRVKAMELLTADDDEDGDEDGDEDEDEDI